MKRLIWLVCVCFMIAGTVPLHAQKKKRARKENPVDPKQKNKDKKPKTISQFIKKDAHKDEGLFTIYEQDDKLYFEVTQHLLAVDMLLVSRIVKIPSDLSAYMNAGSKVGEQAVIWEKKNKQILLRTKSFQNKAEEDDPIIESVENNNFQPIIASFKIEAYNKDSTHYLIDVSSLYKNDIKALSGLNSKLRSTYKVKNLDKSRSFLESAKSFPINIEIQHVTTFNAGHPPAQRKTETLSLLMNQSLILLPEETMQQRYSDERVGWFSMRQIDYSSSALKSDQKRYIKRWKLIPKDIEAYKRGELVEPIKPIVYYLDPATPLKWRPYFRQGIEDWNACFETAGFKNAIVALDAPTKEEDPDFSPEDARFSVVRYVASTTRNAVGPSVSDPRTGEIIESDIIWYHNHLRSYRNRYLLETGAANPKARTLETPDEEIGEMMRRVISHEIGHALGLPHNMKASAAYPVDSLRNGAFTQKYGIATTIMDYARYNYVAQPGDKNIRFVRQIGPYDHYAINWGYRYIPDATTESEKVELKKWITDKGTDPVYLFGGGYPRFDPNSLTENIGDDNIAASSYGIKNLKIVGNNLAKWTSKDGETYDDLAELYGEYLSVWGRYIGHVLPLIGGVHETLKTTDQAGPVYTHVSRMKQQAALDFMINNGLKEQLWLTPKGISENISHSSSLEKITARQSNFLKGMLDNQRLSRMLENEYQNGTNAFTVLDYLNQLTAGLFDVNHVRVSASERTIQRAYMELLLSKLQGADKKNADVSAVVRYQLEKIRSFASNNTSGNSIHALHYRNLVAEYDLAFAKE